MEQKQINVEYTREQNQENADIFHLRREGIETKMVKELKGKLYPHASQLRSSAKQHKTLLTLQFDSDHK